MRHRAPTVLQALLTWMKMHRLSACYAVLAHMLLVVGSSVLHVMLDRLTWTRMHRLSAMCVVLVPMLVLVPATATRVRPAVLIGMQILPLHVIAALLVSIPPVVT